MSAAGDAIEKVITDALKSKYGQMEGGALALSLFGWGPVPGMVDPAILAIQIAKGKDQAGQLEQEFTKELLLKSVEKAVELSVKAVLKKAGVNGAAVAAKLSELMELLELPLLLLEVALEPTEIGSESPSVNHHVSNQDGGSNQSVGAVGPIGAGGAPNNPPQVVQTPPPDQTPPPEPTDQTPPPDQTTTPLIPAFSGTPLDATGGDSGPPSVSSGGGGSSGGGAGGGGGAHIDDGVTDDQEEE